MHQAYRLGAAMGFDFAVRSTRRIKSSRTAIIFTHNSDIVQPTANAMIIKNADSKTSELAQLEALLANADDRWKKTIADELRKMRAGI